MKRLLLQNFQKLAHKEDCKFSGISQLLSSRQGPQSTASVIVYSNSYATNSKKTQKINSNVEEHDAAEKAKFSPSRRRESSSAQIKVKYNQPNQVFTGGFMSDQSSRASSFAHGVKPSDSHVNVYDCNHTASLSSVMESNVPSPYQRQGSTIPPNMNISGGQWAHNDMYTSGEQQECHHSKIKKQRSRKPSSDTLEGTRNYSTFHPGCQLFPSQKPSLLILKPRCLNPHRHLSFVSHVTNSSKSIHAFAPSLLGYPNPKTFHTCCILFEIKSDTNQEKDKKNQRQKLKAAVRDYGSTVIVFHVTISLISLGICYFLISCGIDMIGLLKQVGIDLSDLQEQPEEIVIAGDPPKNADSLSEIEEEDSGNGSNRATTTSSSTSRTGTIVAGVSTFVIAYAVHKVMAPLRIAITLTATPFIVRHLRKIGVLKMPKGKG